MEYNQHTDTDSVAGKTMNGLTSLSLSDESFRGVQ